MSDPGFSVVLVCTGNICRSALAERLGRAWAGPSLAITSAGTHAVVGSGMHPESARVLRALGGDPTGFRARQLTEADAAAADLVLTMTREHRAEVLGMAPRALARTFTLAEAADLVGLVPAGSVADERSLVRAMAAARSRHRAGPDDDVADPFGGPPAAHDAAGEAIARALRPVLDRLVGLGVSRPAA